LEAALREIGIDVEVHRLIERHRQSFAEDENDILRRILPLVPITPVIPPAPPESLGATDPGPSGSRASSSVAPGNGVDRAAGNSGSPSRRTRRRGQFTVELRGERIPAANLKSAYWALLERLDSDHPEFLAAFAEEGRRSRRFVARTQAQLYTASPHLAKRHAARLDSGWYFDSNVSAVQVARRARIAARICGLRYGADVRILENLREI
jgi:hypothetical protein